MDRGSVDDDRNRTCSNGLHFAAHSYAKMFGGGRGHMMVVEVDPADVVAIPNDYANQKGRAWKLSVIAEITEELPKREVYDYNPNKVGGWDGPGTESSTEDDSEDFYVLGYDDGVAGDRYSNPTDSDAYRNGYDDGCSVREDEGDDGEVDLDDDALRDKEYDARDVKNFKLYGLHFYDCQLPDGASLYDLGAKHGKAHRPRKYPHNVNEEYDMGYADGRTGTQDSTNGYFLQD